MDWLLLVEESVVNIGIPLDMLVLFKTFSKTCVYDFFWFFETFQHSLLCLVGELSVGGSVAVAVGNSDRLQLTGER